MKNLKALFISLALSLALTACIDNSGGKVSKAVTSATSGAKSGTTTTTTTLTNLAFTLADATVSIPAGDGSQVVIPDFTLIFNASNPTSTLNDVCKVQTGGSGGAGTDTSRACKCRFEWTETNNSGADLYQRIYETEPTQISSFQVQCHGPNSENADIWGEIPDDKIIRVSLIPDVNQGNLSGFTTNTLLYTKKSTSSQGDFRDKEGRSYQNISHYVCYDTVQKSLSIGRKMQSPGNTNNQNGQAIPPFPLANEFVVSGDNSGSYSGQSYYYDFYVITKEIGQINAGGNGFECPRVNVSGESRFFPLDSTLALSLNKSKDFTVPVYSQTIIATSGSTPGNLLGYAAKPNGDGSCPSFTDSNNRVRRTFRVRKHSAVYPLRFGADGGLLDQSQRVNTIYVLDRPVDRAGQDPLKPITRLGPKPCPFSFKTAQFGQKCTSDSSLSGWNIDGTQINGDRACPIYPPPVGDGVPQGAYKADGTLVVRPFKPFFPFYMEDTSFKACAFQSSNPVDPEIVLAHDDSANPVAIGPNDFYCAKHYPSPGSIIAGGTLFDKPPGDCDLSSTVAVLKSNKLFACSRSYNPTNSNLNTPAAGCCQICSGPNCTAQGGGLTNRGRNAVFSPPSDAGNPPQASKILPRAVPNKAGEGGCFDPYES